MVRGLPQASELLQNRNAPDSQERYRLRGVFAANIPTANRAHTAFDPGDPGAVKGWL